MQTKMYALLVALLASVAFVGCTSDNDVADDGTMKQLSFSAEIDGGNVSNYASERMKTQLHPDQGNSVTFTAGDAISVFDATTLENKRFTTNKSGANVTFSGDAPESQTYTALYPYQEDAKISGQTITAVLPTTQFAQSGQTFDPQATLGVATTTRDEMAFAFKNVCGLVKFTTTEELAKIVFKGNSGEKVAGNVSITVSAEPTATGDGESITLLPAEGASIPTGTYYIAVLPQAFKKGFTLEAYRDASSATPNYTLNIKTPAPVERTDVLNMGKMEDPFSHHDYVDLGIVVNGKKVLWATMNVGATTETGYGDYFAWGETKPKSDYSWDNYKWGTNSDLTKYNGTDGKTVLDLEDDAARQNWGGKWVMPTQDEWQALTENCEGQLTELNGVKGWKYTSKNNGESIFFPVKVGETFRGTYWSSTLSSGYNSTNAYKWYFYFDETIYVYSDDRYLGYYVRPVIRVTK